MGNCLKCRYAQAEMSISTRTNYYVNDKELSFVEERVCGICNERIDDLMRIRKGGVLLLVLIFALFSILFIKKSLEHFDKDEHFRVKGEVKLIKKHL